MRHGKRFNHLSRLAPHRKALLSNLAKSLILNKRINTTVAKAKALRKFVEPILTKAKQDDTHSRRVVFAHFQDKVPVKELFNEIAPKIADRPGGYTRIIRLGNRLGDNAEMCMIELVDYNELLQKEAKPEKSKTRRSRSKVAAEEAPKSEQEAVVAETATTEAQANEVTEEVAAAGPQVEESTDSTPEATDEVSTTEGPEK